MLFYKFLTDKEYEFFKENELTDEEMYQITEDDTEIVEFCKKELGYFIEPKYFYRRWIENLREFSEDDLTVALSSYERNIDENKKHVFSGIFDTLTRNLSALAPTSNGRTKALRDLIITLKDVPTTNNEYDVLGYIYEYLISNFASNAGKKSGEFYSPAHSGGTLSRIIGYNLKDRETITVLDPTVGSSVIIMITADSNDVDWLSRPLLENKNMDWCAF